MDEEQDLIRRSKQNDLDAFCAIVFRYQAPLRAYVAQYIPQSADILEIVQDTFLVAFRSLDSFDADQPLGPWLRGIARHRALNFIRAKKRSRLVYMPELDEIIAGDGQKDEDSETFTSRHLESLKECLQLLKPEHQKIVQMRYYRDIPVQRIAEQLSRSAAGISMLLVRIRSALAKCMNQKLSCDP